MFLFFLYAIPALFYLILSFTSFLENPKSSIHRSFSVFSFGLFTWIVTLYLYFFVDVGDWFTFLGRVNYSSGVLVSAGLAAFFYFFPQKKIKLPLWGEKILFLYCLILFLIILFTPLVAVEEFKTESGEGDTIEGPLYQLYSISVAAGGIIAFFWGLRKIFVLSGIEKKKFQYAFWGSVPICFLCYIFLLFILHTFDLHLLRPFSILLIVPMGMAFYYAIHHYRFFQFSYLFLKILRFFVICSLIIVGGGLFFEIISIFGSKIHEAIQLFFSYLVGMLLFVWLEKIFPEFTTYQFREFRNSIQELQSKIYFCNNYRALRQHLEEVFIIKNNISHVGVYSVQPQKVDIHIPIYIEDEFTKKIRTYKKSGLVWEEIKSQKFPPKTLKVFEKAFIDLKMEVCLPLFVENHLIGFLALGNKNKNDSYSLEEMKELLKLRDAIQVCFMNILLKNNLQKENDLMKLTVEEKTKELKKLSLQQADFIAITAHELRTPLTIALLKLETLEKDPKIASKLTDATKAIKRLKVLIQKFFDVQKYDLDKVILNLVNVEIQEFIQEIYEAHQPLMKAKKIKFEIDNQLKRKFELEIDAFQMQQVFENILSNAIRYVPQKGGIIKITLKKVPRGVTICLANNGPAIAPQKKKYIFEKFRDDDQRFTGEGIGLGLYICRKIVELHKGKIWAENCRGLKGPKFCVQLFKK